MPPARMMSWPLSRRRLRAITLGPEVILTGLRGTPVPGFCQFLRDSQELVDISRRIAVQRRHPHRAVQPE